MSKAKVRSFHLAVAWPAIAGLLVYSLKGPHPVWMAVFFMLSLSVFINSDERESEKKWVCCVMLVYQIIAGVHVWREAPELYQYPNIWIAFRLLNVAGLAIFFPPLIEKPLKIERWKTWAVVVSMSFILGAFLWYADEHAVKEAPKTVHWAQKDHARNENLEILHCVRIEGISCTVQPPLEPWYGKSSLLDDVAFGIAVGLLASTTHFPARRRELKQRPAARRRPLFDAFPPTKK